MAPALTGITSNFTFPNHRFNRKAPASPHTTRADGVRSKRAHGQSEGERGAAAPKTGLCYFHPRLLIAKNKKPLNSFYFPFNNLISPLLIYRVFENKMFGDNLQYIPKKHPHFHCKNTPIVPQHSGDSLPGFSHLPRLSPNPQNTPGGNTQNFLHTKCNLFSSLPTHQQNHLS